MRLNHASLVGAMLALASAGPTTRAAAPTVTTILGTGVPGYSNTQVNNPYGIIFGPDGAIFFCDLERQNHNSHRVSTAVRAEQRDRDASTHRDQ